MSKDSFYFSHDYNSRTDDKIKKLIRKHGMTGYGVFWAIIEDLYNNANALRMECEGIAYDLRVDEKIIKSIINDFDLFKIEGDFFKSESIERRLSERNDKSVKARQSAQKRWGINANASDINANAMRDECEGNAIKERKGKERKEEKEIFKEKVQTEQERIDEINGLYPNLSDEEIEKNRREVEAFLDRVVPNETKNPFSFD